VRDKIGKYGFLECGGKKYYNFSKVNNIKHGNFQVIRFDLLAGNLDTMLDVLSSIPI
jgi:hypothetical protein